MYLYYAVTLHEKKRQLAPTTFLTSLPARERARCPLAPSSSLLSSGCVLC